MKGAIATAAIAALPLADDPLPGLGGSHAGGHRFGAGGAGELPGAELIYITNPSL